MKAGCSHGRQILLFFFFFWCCDVQYLKCTNIPSTKLSVLRIQTWRGFLRNVPSEKYVDIVGKKVCFRTLQKNNKAFIFQIYEYAAMLTENQKFEVVAFKSDCDDSCLNAVNTEEIGLHVSSRPNHNNYI